MGSTHGDPTIQAQAHGAWRDLTREVLRHRGPSVVSMEFLSHAGPEQARRVMSSLGEAEVHVVLTVRDAARTVPAQWQTMVRNGSTLSWHAFRRGARRADGRRARPGRIADPAAVKLRNAQDVARMLEVWRRFVPPERIHVVTVPVPGGDRSVLWQRFSEAVGLDPRIGGTRHDGEHVAGLRLGGAAAAGQRRAGRRAVGPTAPPGASAVRGRFGLSDYNATVREELAGTGAGGAQRPGGAAVAGPSHRGLRAVVERADPRGRERRHGRHLVGDLADLPVDRGRPGPVDDHQPVALVGAAARGGRGVGGGHEAARGAPGRSRGPPRGRRTGGGVGRAGRT